MKRTALLFLVLLVAAACGNGDGASSDAAAGADASPFDGGMEDPPMPPLGAQIDRAGRPAVNSPLNHTFDPDADLQAAAKDAYNADGDPANWSSYVPEFQANLAILDALDTTDGSSGCGTQILYDATASNETAYAPLATALVDDQLYVDSDQASCEMFLAVEANAALGLSVADCGGRTPSMDVIDVTFTYLVKGLVDVAADGIHDGVDADDQSHSSAEFPFLAAPGAG